MNVDGAVSKNLQYGYRHRFELNMTEWQLSAVADLKTQLAVVALDSTLQFYSSILTERIASLLDDTHPLCRIETHR